MFANRERVILHSDLNNFYASVECLKNSALKEMPLVVSGDCKLRHGIVLAKNYAASAYGIKTGDTIWQAKLSCPNLHVVGANFKEYLKVSQEVREIYARYTDFIEPFGIDECWLDVTQSTKLFGSGKQIADRIRQDIKNQIGITASVGVSFNKVYAKIGSDIKKPDATTVINKLNYKNIVYALPSEALLYVGQATKAKLKMFGIDTIGKIATADINFLQRILGKWGGYLQTFARGEDLSQVAHVSQYNICKSVGNSTTTPRDMQSFDDIIMMITVMAESVAYRLRSLGLKGDVIALSIRNTDLVWQERQRKIEMPTNLASVIMQTAKSLYVEGFNNFLPARSLGVKVLGISSLDKCEQLNLFYENKYAQKQKKLEYSIDGIKKKFGQSSIKRAVIMLDNNLTQTIPVEDNIIHPQSFF